MKTIFPILLVHGWPGSFYEDLKSIPMLTEPDSNGMAYEIILPSIPGYGYSERPHKPGFNIPAAARMFVKLMKRLGHEKFIVHGGDWGSAISLAISTIYPEKYVFVLLLFLFCFFTKKNQIFIIRIIAQKNKMKTRIKNHSMYAHVILIFFYSTFIQESFSFSLLPIEYIACFCI